MTTGDYFWPNHHRMSLTFRSSVMLYGCFMTKRVLQVKTLHPYINWVHQWPRSMLWTPVLLLQLHSLMALMAWSLCTLQEVRMSCSLLIFGQRLAFVMVRLEQWWASPMLAAIVLPVCLLQLLSSSTGKLDHPFCLISPALSQYHQSHMSGVLAMPNSHISNCLWSLGMSLLYTSLKVRHLTRLWLIWASERWQLAARLLLHHGCILWRIVC